LPNRTVWRRSSQPGPVTRSKSCQTSNTAEYFSLQACVNCSHTPVTVKVELNYRREIGNLFWFTSALGRRFSFSRDLGEVSILGSPFLLSVFPFLVRFAFCVSLSLYLSLLLWTFSLFFFSFFFCTSLLGSFFFFQFFFLNVLYVFLLAVHFSCLSSIMSSVFFSFPPVCVLLFPCSVYDIPLSFFSSPLMVASWLFMRDSVW